MLVHTPSFDHLLPPGLKSRSGQRKATKLKPIAPLTNPDFNPEVLDGPEALRASPDANEKDEKMDIDKVELGTAARIKDEDESVPSLVNAGNSDSSLSDVSEFEPDIQPPSTYHPRKTQRGKLTNTTRKTVEPQKLSPAIAPKRSEDTEAQFLDPEAEGDVEAGEEEIQAALSRPPPVHSEYLPLPWKGRLGYVRPRCPQ